MFRNLSLGEAELQYDERYDSDETPLP